MAEVSGKGLCPLCGRGNDCGVEAGRGNCWCFSTGVPEDLLETLPEELRMEACICASCIESHRRLPKPQQALRRILRRRS
ncbi:MAG: cysteine-rich CWC family protein [Sinobacteraceae bacterium]|nr:cysteine-rich CWC family protein [Nevskiaceae bacterium]MCP5338726.1 cysteine-rich CWC family protein [Nevskiaceae bacterium]MCP5360871.1 cysteine-rich CWC family protein [Nevskiaceae bacterium]MCP5473111.1 cysteine-rich CWC family protein [Nevskiaceae bacterium]